MREVLRRRAHRRGGDVVDAGEHLGHVDVLAGQPRAQHVVGGGHDLDSEPADVGVHAARGHKEGLPRLQRDRVEQQRCGDPGVSREGTGHDDGVGVHARRRGRPLADARGDLGDELIDLHSRGTGVLGYQVGEDLTDAEAGGIQAQGAPHAVSEGGVESRQDLGGAARGAEAGDGLVATERQDHLRLVIGVLVGTGGIVQGQAGLVLELEALGRLLQGGVDLQRQRLVGGDELEEEGQLGTEPTDDVLAQQPLRVRIDEIGQRTRTNREPGRSAWVGAVPLLRPRVVVRALAEQLRDGCRRAPVV